MFNKRGKESWSQGLHSTSSVSEQLGEEKAQGGSSVAPGGGMQGGQRSSKASWTWPLGSLLWALLGEQGLSQMDPQVPANLSHPAML